MVSFCLLFFALSFRCFFGFCLVYFLYTLLIYIFVKFIDKNGKYIYIYNKENEELISISLQVILNLSSYVKHSILVTYFNFVYY